MKTWSNITQIYERVEKLNFGPFKIDKMSKQVSHQAQLSNFRNPSLVPVINLDLHKNSKNRILEISKFETDQDQKFNRVMDADVILKEV